MLLFWQIFLTAYAVVWLLILLAWGVYGIWVLARASRR